MSCLHTLEAVLHITIDLASRNDLLPSRNFHILYTLATPLETATTVAVVTSCNASRHGHGQIHLKQIKLIRQFVLLVLLVLLCKQVFKGLRLCGVVWYITKAWKNRLPANLSCNSSSVISAIASEADVAFAATSSVMARRRVGVEADALPARSVTAAAEMKEIFILWLSIVIEDNVSFVGRDRKIN